MLKSVWIIRVFLINSGKLFQREEPTREIAVCPMFVFSKRHFNFFKFISCIYSTIFSKFKNFFQIKEQVLLKNLNVIMFIHWLTLLLVGNQFTDLKFSSDMWCTLSSLRQNLMHLFCRTCIFFFFFFSKIRVPGWIWVIKMWMNKCIAEHSSKFWV